MSPEAFEKFTTNVKTVERLKESVETSRAWMKLHADLGHEKEVKFWKRVWWKAHEAYTLAKKEIVYEHQRS